jgi:hypothetical protein
LKNVPSRHLSKAVKTMSERFDRDAQRGHGDYTAEREALFGQATLDQILGEIKAAAKDRDSKVAKPES